MASHEILKANVRARLEQLGISPYKAAVSTGKPPSWFTGLLNPNRHKTKVSSAIIDEAARCLGVTPHQMIDPEFAPEDHPMPAWLVQAQVINERRGENARETD